MGRTGAVENCRRAIDQAPSELGLIQVAPEHENRQYGPVMRMLRHLSTAEVDDSADDHPTGLMQHVHWQRLRWRDSIRDRRPARKCSSLTVGPVMDTRSDTSPHVLTPRNRPRQ